MPEDIRQLENKIAALQQREAETRSKVSDSEVKRASRIGLRIGTELLSAIIVGAALGYVADEFFGTRPWCMTVFLFFGGAAGVLNVYRLARQEDGKSIRRHKGV